MKKGILVLVLGYVVSFGLGYGSVSFSKLINNSPIITEVATTTLRVVKEFEQECKTCHKVKDYYVQTVQLLEPSDYYVHTVKQLEPYNLYVR